MGFGAALWLGGDELFAPLRGDADPPSRTPLPVQGMGRAGHDGIRHGDFWNLGTLQAALEETHRQRGQRHQPR